MQRGPLASYRRASLIYIFMSACALPAALFTTGSGWSVTAAAAVVSQRETLSLYLNRCNNNLPIHWRHSSALAVVHNASPAPSCPLLCLFSRVGGQEMEPHCKSGAHYRLKDSVCSFIIIPSGSCFISFTLTHPFLWA